MDQIEGLNGQELPFEGSLLTPKVRQNLGVFKHLVLLLLARNPQERPSIAEFCETCSRILEGSIAAGQ